MLTRVIIAILWITVMTLGIGVTVLTDRLEEANARILTDETIIEACSE